MSHHVYILFSQKLQKFYIGNTDLNPEKRLEQHNSKEKENAFTIRGAPWEIYFVIHCSSRLQARRIESHIKKMISKKYIHNLIKYPEITQKLLEKYELDD